MKHDTRRSRGMWIGKIGRRFRSLKPVFREWAKVINEYSSKLKNKDHAWWYRERPHIGFLSAAAWRVGGVTLEEWGMKKGIQRGKESNGRNDLWLRFGRSDWFIEAKHAWCEIQKSEKACKGVISRSVKGAEESCRQVSGKPRIAAVFITPLWKPGKNKKSDFRSDAEKWERICSEQDVDVVVFARPGNHVRYWKGQDNERWLGVVLVLKSVS